MAGIHAGIYVEDCIDSVQTARDSANGAAWQAEAFDSQVIDEFEGDELPDKEESRLYRGVAARLPNIAPERPAATRDEINLQEQRGPLRNSVDPVKVAEFDGFYGVTHPALARFLQPTPYYPVVDEGLGLTRSIGRRDSNTSVVAVGYEWNSFFGGTAANTSESYYEVVKQAE